MDYDILYRNEYLAHESTKRILEARTEAAAKLIERISELEARLSAATDREQLVTKVIAAGKRWWPSVRAKANHARMERKELDLWQAIRAVMEFDGEPTP